MHKRHGAPGLRLFDAKKSSDKKLPKNSKQGKAREGIKAQHAVQPRLHSVTRCIHVMSSSSSSMSTFIKRWHALQDSPICSLACALHALPARN
jgi:hypothetical protein